MRPLARPMLSIVAVLAAFALLCQFAIDWARCADLNTDLAETLQTALDASPELIAETPANLRTRRRPVIHGNRDPGW